MTKKLTLRDVLPKHLSITINYTLAHDEKKHVRRNWTKHCKYTKRGLEEKERNEVTNAKRTEMFRRNFIWMNGNTDSHTERMC